MAGEGGGGNGGAGGRGRTGVGRDRSAVARLGADPGLCATCRHLELVASARSVFARCGRSDDDPRFLRYPPLPVLRCLGYEGLAAEESRDATARPGAQAGPAGEQVREEAGGEGGEEAGGEAGEED